MSVDEIRTSLITCSGCGGGGGGELSDGTVLVINEQAVVIVVIAVIFSVDTVIKSAPSFTNLPFAFRDWLPTVFSDRFRGSFTACCYKAVKEIRE